MSISPFSIINFLEGWDYHGYVIPATPVTKGVYKVLKKIEKPGWLMHISLITDDAYGTLRISYQGAGGLLFVATIYPELNYVLGAVQQDPAGWVQLYNRPIALSTYGLYVLALTPGWQGAPLPYVKPYVLVEGTLGALSTQDSATIAADVFVIEIIDEAGFKKSLRRFNRETGGLSKILGGIPK